MAHLCQLMLQTKLLIHLYLHANTYEKWLTEKYLQKCHVSDEAMMDSISTVKIKIGHHWFYRCTVADTVQYRVSLTSAHMTGYCMYVLCGRKGCRLCYEFVMCVSCWPSYSTVISDTVTVQEWSLPLHAHKVTAFLQYVGGKEENKGFICSWFMDNLHTAV